MASVFMAAYTNYKRDPRVKREAEALVEAGHDVVFVAKRYAGDPRQETVAGVYVLRTPGLPGKPRSIAGYLLDYGIFFFYLLFHLTLHPLRYELIHINNMPDILVFTAWLPRLLGRPVILDVHDLMPELYMDKFQVPGSHWMIRLLLAQEQSAAQFATAVLTVEDHVRDILTLRGVPRYKMSVLINLPDERIFAPLYAPRFMIPFKAAQAPFVLAYHGTLARRLGLDLALRAVAKARAAIPNLEFRIVGNGEERERLIRLVNELELNDVVQFSDDFIPVEDVPARLRDVDVGLVPLRVCDGTDIMLPTKLLEYVQLGIPCIAPKTTTITRYFDDQMVQFFAAENVDALAEAIVDLYRHPDKRDFLRGNSLDRFVQKYRWHEHKNVYLNLVEGLLARNHGQVTAGVPTAKVGGAAQN